jgi:hypothetical protein
LGVGQSLRWQESSTWPCRQRKVHGGRARTTGRPVLSLLRPGKRPSGEEVEQILRHVIGRIRRNWPAVEIIVRGDSQFATPEVMDLSGGLNAGQSLREG